MHARELVELAGLVAYNGPLLLAESRQSRTEYLDQYWAAARCRNENWNHALRLGAKLALGETRPAPHDIATLEATLEEIFTSELLARVWTAVMVAWDRTAGEQAFEAIARNILAAHMEARHRALALLVDGRLLSTEQSVGLNRVRRRAERWSDVLIGGLLHVANVSQFAVDPERARDFAADLAERRHEPAGRQAWRLTIASLRNSYERGALRPAANPDANARLGSSILACFPPEAFDSTGLFKSLWMMRLKVNTGDAQGLLGELLGVSTSKRPTTSRLHWPRAN